MKKFPQNSILNTINYPHSILDLDPNKVDNDKTQSLIVYTVSVDVSNTELELCKISLLHVCAHAYVQALLMYMCVDIATIMLWCVTL